MKPATRNTSALERLECRRLLSAASAAAIAYLRQGPQPVAQAPGDAQLAVVGGTAATGRQPTGALSGKVVFTVGGHGYVSDNATGWHTQRPLLLNMVEDLGNQDQMTFYVNHLFNAGATVVPLRGVGYQPNEVLLDNDDPGVTFTGTWSNSAESIFFGSAGDVPFKQAATSATETATAKYQPNIPQAGFYPVYTWAGWGSNRTNQLYRITSAGGVTEVRVDHRRVGRGYVYLGTYYFNAGTGGFVEISNQGTPGAIVIADHIRFGNGMGSIARGGLPSGQTRSDESTLYWIESQVGQGTPTSEYRTLADDDDANVRAPNRWAEYMNNETVGPATERIFLSFHSNAAGGRGDLGLYNGNNDPTSKTPHQFEWASLVGNEVNDDLVAQAGVYEHDWFDNPNPTLDRTDIEFGEINNQQINNEFDATILEVAYHDNQLDAELMRDPKVRDAVARASLQATVKYFNQFAAGPLSFPPDSPGNVRAVSQTNGDVTLSWAAPASNGVVGDPATGYVVYTSANGYGFGNAITIAGGATLTLTIPAAQVGGATYFRVAATNAGGESMPSEVMAARGVGPAAKILIVNGFDRLTRQQNPLQFGPTDYTPPFVPNPAQPIERVRPRFSNSYDYAVQFAEAVKTFSGGLSFDTASNEAVIAGQVPLANYAAVLWISGEESTADDTFNATEQSLVTSYLSAGGKLFTSGSEIGWDLDLQGSAADRAFYNNQLKADLTVAADDDAGSYSATGAAGSIFAGISLGFDDGTSGTYNVDFPDKLAAVAGTPGSTIAMNYTGSGSGGAAVQYANPANGGRVVNMGFPFETITTAANRNAVMSAVLTFFGLAGGTISGRVYRDTDGDSNFDAGEPPLGGWTIFVDSNANLALDAGEPTTTSNAAGEWFFSGRPVGGQAVRAVQQPAFVRTSPAGNGSYFVNVTDGSNNSGREFGEFPVVYTGSASNDAYTLRVDPANATRVQIIETGSGGSTTYGVAKSLLTTLSFDGGTGDDAFTIDLTNGNPLPSGGISVAGGTGVVGDGVVVTGSTSSDNVSLTANALTVAGGSVSLSGVETFTFNANAGDDSLTINAPTPAVTFNGGASTLSDMFTIAGGSYTFNADAKLTTTRLALVVNAGASATFNSTQHLTALTVNGTATLTAGGARVIVTDAISVPGRLDLKDNDLVVNYTGSSSPITTIAGRIASGRGSGNWAGNGIVTSVASGNVTTVGVAEAAQAKGLGGGQTGLFSGETVDDTAVLVKFTYGGDANLDGTLNIDDYGHIDTSVGLGLSGWFNGDFNYDGKINIDDYGIIDVNIGNPGALL